MRYDQEERYKEELTRTLLASADVAPDTVRLFLERQHHPETRERLLTWPAYYGSALRYLTAEYAAFVLKRLIIPLDQLDLDYSDFGDGAWGIQGYMRFYPVAPNQGPFLDLLRQNEEEGLRLIHALANHTADAWRRREGQAVLPVMIDVAGEQQPFWGNDYVYGWFRTYSTGPGAVACALSALEMWVEEQAVDRPSAELFETVLRGSHSVAVLGLLIGVALADPFRHLEGVLPLIITPRLWRMDIARCTNDLSYNNLIHTHRDQPSYYQALKDSEARPQRKIESRTLFPLYLLAARHEQDEGIKNGVGHLFIRAIAGLKPENFAETKAQWRDRTMRTQFKEDLVRHKRMADPNRLKLTPQEGGFVIGVDQPEVETEREAREASAPAQYLRQAMRLHNWSSKAYLENQLDGSMTVEEAFETAKALSEKEIPNTTDDNEQRLIEMLAPAGIVGVAAIVPEHGGDWAREPERLLWCRSVLLTVTRDTSPGDDYYHGVSGIGTRAARGLGVLATEDPTDEEVVRALFGLFPSINKFVIAQAFSGLRGCWEKCPELGWSALGLLIELAAIEWFLRDDDALWSKIRATVERYTSLAVQKGSIRSPTVPLGKWLWTEVLAAALKNIPLDVMMSTDPNRTLHLALFDSFMAWTLNEHRLHNEDRGSTPRAFGQHGHHHSYWEPAFADWAVRLSDVLTEDEYQAHVLDPLFSVWPSDIKTITHFLGAFLGQHIYWKEMPLEPTWTRWRMACDTLLSAAVQWLGERRSVPSDARGALGCVLLIHHGSWLKRDWPHAHRLADLVERWVNAVGNDADCFSILVQFLDGPGWSLGARRALMWISLCFKRSPEPATFLQRSKTGYALSKLLWRLWSERRQEIDSSSEALRQLSDLADQLVETGESLGGMLQRALERRDLVKPT